MQKKQKIIVAAILVLVLAIASGVYFMTQPSDTCTAKDREQNNCVPADRCTPPGDPQEQTIDCPLKNYDHKFHLSN